jgi:hypothetical protein
LDILEDIEQELPENGAVFLLKHVEVHILDDFILVKLQSQLEAADCHEEKDKGAEVQHLFEHWVDHLNIDCLEYLVVSDQWHPTAVDHDEFCQVDWHHEDHGEEQCGVDRLDKREKHPGQVQKTEAVVVHVCLEPKADAQHPDYPHRHVLVQVAPSFLHQ